MAIYSYIYDIAYLPFIMLYLNTMVLAYYNFGVKKTFYLFISTLDILVFVRLIPIEIDPYIVDAGFSSYSYYEIFCNLFATLLFFWIVRKRKHAFGLLILSLFTIIPLLGALTMEMIGIWSLVVLYKTISEKHDDPQGSAIYIFITLELIVSALLLIFTNHYYCERMIDIRPESMHLIKKQNGTYYYAITPIHDNEKKIKQIQKELGKYSDGRFVILEDKKAAYSFRRSSIRTSLYAVDPLDYSLEDVNEIVIEKKEGKQLIVK